MILYYIRNTHGILAANLRLYLIRLLFFFKFFLSCLSRQAAVWPLLVYCARLPDSRQCPNPAEGAAARTASRAGDRRDN